MSDITNLANRLAKCDFIVFDGASGSGKTYVASRVARLLEKSHVILIVRQMNHTSTGLILTL